MCCRHVDGHRCRRPSRNARRDELVDKMKENLYDSFRAPIASTILVKDVWCDDVAVAVADAEIDTATVAVVAVADNC